MCNLQIDLIMIALCRLRIGPPFGGVSWMNRGWETENLRFGGWMHMGGLVEAIGYVWRLGICSKNLGFADCGLRESSV